MKGFAQSRVTLGMNGTLYMSDETKEKVVIGLGGLIGSGKTTIARVLTQRLLLHGKTSTVMSFATPLKEMMKTMLVEAGVHPHIANSWVNDRIQRDVKRDLLGGNTMRWALQTLGTEWGRDLLHKELWAWIAEGRARRAPYDVVIFDDVRFASEAKQMDHTFRLIRSEIEDAYDHPSEGMDYYATDIPNDGAVEDVADLILKYADLI